MPVNNSSDPSPPSPSSPPSVEAPRTLSPADMPQYDYLYLTELGQIFAKYYGVPGVSYPRMHRLVVGGLVPAKKINKGWILFPKDVPAMARQLGISTPQ